MRKKEERVYIFCLFRTLNLASLRFFSIPDEIGATIRRSFVVQPRKQKTKPRNFRFENERYCRKETIGNSNRISKRNYKRKNVFLCWKNHSKHGD